MSDKNLRARFDRQARQIRKTILTDAEKEELKRRSENHDANKEIMALRSELKGINLSISILKLARDSRMDRIKELEADKRTASRGGA